jgi:hypothetical protein
MLLPLLFLALDLTSVRNEPNLERRSELALDYANSALDTARNSYNGGDSAKVEPALNDVGDAVDVAYEALSETGKNPRNNKYFKKAELRTRELMRRLDGLMQTVSFDDRAPIAKVRERIADVHDNLLQGIMSKKQKK